MLVSVAGRNRLPLAFSPLGAQLRVEPQGHQVIERPRQFACEFRLEHAEFAQLVQALDGVGLLQSAFDGQRAHAMHDGENAALLEIQRVAVAFRGFQRVEQADRRLEGLDGAGETCEEHPLVGGLFDQRLFRAQRAATRRRPRLRRRRRWRHSSPTCSSGAVVQRLKSRNIVVDGARPQGIVDHDVARTGREAEIRQRAGKRRRGIFAASPRRPVRTGSGHCPGRCGWSVRRGPRCPSRSGRPCPRISGGQSSSNNLCEQAAI